MLSEMLPVGEFVMYRVLSCLTGQHDYQLVALAALICILASFSAFWLLPAALAREGSRRILLITLAGTTTATGIWATHFVAMLAWDAGLPVGYDLAITFASLIIAVTMTTLGLALMKSDRRQDIALAGIVIGIGIAGMHFTGMSALVVSGHLTWDKTMVAFAVVIGAALSAAATLTFTTVKTRTGRVGAPLLMVLAICSLHFTAMGALTIVPDPTMAAGKLGYESTSLAFMIAGATIFLMLAAALATIIDRFTIARGMLGFGGAFLATLLATIAVSVYAFELIRIGGPNFQRIAAGKDLIADVLPPPVYIIETYLEARLAAANPQDSARYTARFAALRKEYLARKDHWAQSTLIPTQLKEHLVKFSHAQVELFWNILDERFVPALSKRDTLSAELALEEMHSHYIAHRRIVEDVVNQSQKFATDVEGGADATLNSLRKLLAGALLLLLAVVGGTMIAINRLVIMPVLGTADHLQTLTSGHYDQKTPYVGRQDEIGVMAKSIEMLRRASLEKRRIEKEAAEARLVRDKERAAEALRIKMANESITTLNADLQQAFDQLRHAQDDNIRKGKLAQLGQLTATVAHEIRNPLGAVKTAIYLIDRKTKDKSLGIEQQMQRINNGIMRCDKIITELLDFTRTKSLAETAQPVDEWLAGMIEEERRSLPAQLTIDASYGAGSTPVLFDAGRMRRVIINLLSNAAEAMVGKAGESVPNPTEQPRIVITTSIIGGNVQIAVADNGPGISPENLARIREPLFTTKSFGVGLGLPAIENILEQHGGGLMIESSPGEGATMTAWFPMREAARSAHEQEQEQKKVA